MKNLIKLFFSLMALSIFMGGVDGAYCAQEQVVAVVNNEVITQKDLVDFMRFIRLEYAEKLEGEKLEQKVDSMKRDLLARLIEDRLISQQAKLEKFSVEPARVKARISQIRSHYASDADFNNDLAKQGLVLADLENKISEQMLMQGFVQQKVRSKVMIRPDEITAFYSAHKDELLKPEARRLTLIMLADGGNAKTLSNQLRLGARIEDLATRFDFTLDSFTAVAGEQLRPQIEAAVFKLGLGEVSDPIKVDSQYYIFKLEEIIPAQPQTLAQAQDKIQSYLFEQKIQEELNKWLDELKTRAYIKVFEN